MHMNLAFLTKSPATSNGLVISPERVSYADKSHTSAVLPVQAEPGNLWLCNQYADISVCKVM